MAAVVALAAQCRTKLVSTAVCALVYSCLRSSLNLGLTELAELLLTSPGAGVAILGLCVSSWAAHTAYYNTGSSSSSPKTTWWDKSTALTGAQTVQKYASQQEHMVQTGASGQFSAASSSSSRPVRLAQPLADLSIPLGGSSSRQLYSNSCKPRRRRLPRLSVELTPLPRLSIDFSGHRQAYSSSSSYARASSIRRSLDRCSMMPDDAAYMFRSSSWELAEEQVSSGGLVGCASLQLQQQLPTHAVGETTESLGLGELPSGLGFIEDVINETHLLQVGAIMGETSARGALAAREAGGPVGHPSSFYGSADTLDHGEPWELLVSEGNDNVLYWGWRKPLRKGLNMYMTRSVFLGASPAELRAFMNDDAYRVVWDQSMTVLRPVVQADPSSTTPSSDGSSSGSNAAGSSNAAVEFMAAAAAARMSGHGDAETPASSSSGSSGKPTVLPHESAVMQAMVQFPKPMTSRSYLYARRVWPRPSDGGCYCLSKACTLPLSTPLPALPGRSVAVDDYCAGCVIRAPSPQLLPPDADAAGPAAEVFMVYFEDSHVRASLANLGIKKGLWPLVQRTEKALRVYQAGAAANSHLQGPFACNAATSEARPTAQEGCSNSSSEEEVTSEPRPAAVSITRSASLGSCELGSRPAGGAAALSRSQSLQHTSEHTRRLSSASLPCFPLGTGLEDEEVAVDEPCSSCGCSCSGAASSMRDPQHTCCSAGATNDASCCSSKAGRSCNKAEQQQSKQARGAWGWLGSVGSRVAGVIKHSGQLLAAASGVLWRSGPTVTFMLPRFEWRVLTWAYQHLAGSRQLLLGAAAAASGAEVSSRARLAQPSSHPLSEWAPGPGVVVTKLTRQVVRRLPSHPLTAEDLLAAGEEPRRAIATVRSESALQLRIAYAAAAAGSASAPGSCAGSTGGSDVASFSLSCSSCGCCCGGSTGGASSSASRGCHHRSCSASGSSTGGSCVRDETGGKRHRRVVVKLVQTAGLRVARRMGRMAGILE